MILDTNAISAFLEGDERLSLVLESSANRYLPYIAIAEYLYGLRSSKRGIRLRSVFRKVEADCILLLPDRETADWYVTTRHELKEKGRPIPEGDLWIAALARQHELPIVSRDRHFDNVENLQRIGW